MNITIDNMEVNQFHEGMSQLVTFVHWTASEDGVSISGTTKLDAPKGAFREYTSLTEERVKEWVLHKDLAKITTNLANTKKSTLNAATLTPWDEAYTYVEPDDVRVIRQTYQYKEAVARLTKHILADGRPELTEMQDTTEYVVDAEGMLVLTDGEPTFIQEEVIVQTAIEPLEATVEVTTYPEDIDAEPVTTIIENPEITQDNLERAEAQAVVDATPAEVKAA